MRSKLVNKFYAIQDTYDGSVAVYGDMPGVMDCYHNALVVLYCDACDAGDVAAMHLAINVLNKY